MPFIGAALQLLQHHDKQGYFEWNTTMYRDTGPQRKDVIGALKQSHDKDTTGLLYTGKPKAGI